MNKPSIGNVVRLNDHGVFQIGGLPSLAAAEQCKCMKIVDVMDAGTVPPVWGIEVDAPALKHFFLTSRDVDLISER